MKASAFAADGNGLFVPLDRANNVLEVTSQGDGCGQGGGVTARIAEGHDNNFNLIRMVAATAVLISHSWPITKGGGIEEPFESITGHSLGGLAVFVFFALSGFLVSSSAERSASIVSFVISRALRIFPGLMISLLSVAIIMGVFTTELPYEDYLANPDTWLFIGRNLLLVDPQWSLPGVFTSNPYPSVESSIWTLGYELACYGLAACAAFSSLFIHRRIAAIVAASYILLWVASNVWGVELRQELSTLATLSVPFLAGMVTWVWRDKIPLSFIACSTLIVIAVVTRDTVLAYPALITALTYALFWCAFVPAGGIRMYNRLGDYSYGLYIYAFPLQGLSVWLFGAQSPMFNVLVAGPLTLICAVLSWHFVEKPALRLRAKTSQMGRLAKRGLGPSDNRGVSSR